MGGWVVEAERADRVSVAERRYCNISLAYIYNPCVNMNPKETLAAIEPGDQLRAGPRAHACYVLRVTS